MPEAARDTRPRSQPSRPKLGEPAQRRAEPSAVTARSTPHQPGPSTQVTVGRETPPISRPVAPQYRRVYLAMAISDVASVAAGIGLASRLPFGPMSLSVADLLPLFATCVPLVAVVFSSFHLYGAHLLSSAEEFRRLILAVSVATVGLVASPWWPGPVLSRLSIGVSWTISLGFVLATRRMWHRHLRRERSQGRMISRTLIVGTNREAAGLVRGPISRAFGFLPVGFVSTSADGERPDEELPVLGGLGELPRVISEAGVDCLFVASSAVDVEEMRFVSKVANRAGADLRVTATLPEVLSSRLTVQPVGGLMALSLRPVRLTGTQALVKRTFDLAISAFALLLLLPLFLLIAAAIKASRPGPVFYRQRRVGKQGRPFVLLKFRTMVRDADGMLDGLRDRNEVDGPLFKIRRDPRITAVGRWLRRWSLDELPQLLNVLKGDMSLVGPRPSLPHEVKEYRDWHFERLEVRPGMTGLWQVSGRSDLPFDDGVRLDLFYIENWSVAYDMFILFKTIPAVLGSRGAY